MNEIADHIAVTLAEIVGPSEGFDYFLDLLDLVEQERAWLRTTTAPWPGTASDRQLYRAALVVIDGRLRRMIEEVPLGKDFDTKASDELSSLMGEWIQAGKRIIAAGMGGPAH